MAHPKYVFMIVWTNLTLLGFCAGVAMFEELKVPTLAVVSAFVHFIHVLRELKAA